MSNETLQAVASERYTSINVYTHNQYTRAHTHKHAHGIMLYSIFARQRLAADKCETI